MQTRCAKCMKLISDDINVCPYCGNINDQPAEETLFLRPGTMLKDRYVIGGILGYGGFGATYVAWDEMLEHKVAIKEYFPSAFSTRKHNQTALSVFSGDKGEYFRIGLKKYLGEARTMAKLESIPHIVGVKEYFEENNTAYIVMEFVEGITMKEHMRQNGTFSPREVVNLFLPLIKSLSQVHEGNVIHRDISPDNIIINKNGIKLIDFGAAREVFADEEKSLSIVLKHGYAPEEQYHKRGKQGPWTDVYALCATIYKCITGKTPPQVFDRMAGDNIETFSQLGIGIEPHIESAVFKGLSIEIEDRFQSMNELYSALTTVETNVNVTKPEKKVQMAPPVKQNVDFAPVAPLAVPVNPGADTAKPTPEDKNKDSGKNKAVFIIITVAAALIVAIVVTAIAILNRSDSAQMDYPSDSTTSEQTSGVADMPNLNENTFKLTGPDKNVIDGLELEIDGTYDRVGVDSYMIFCIDTHSCEDPYDTQKKIDEYLYTIYFDSERCSLIHMETGFNADEGLTPGNGNGKSEHFEADVDLEFKDDCAVVKIKFDKPIDVSNIHCNCYLGTNPYYSVSVSENAFISENGTGNEGWDKSYNNYYGWH